MTFNKRIRSWIQQIKIWNKLMANRRERPWSMVDQQSPHDLLALDKSVRRGVLRPLLGKPTVEGSKYEVATYAHNIRQRKRNKLSVKYRSKRMLTGKGRTEEWEKEQQKNSHANRLAETQRRAQLEEAEAQYQAAKKRRMEQRGEEK